MRNVACDAAKGVCGKTDRVSGLQDLLLDSCSGLAAASMRSGSVDPADAEFVVKALFATITNANFSEDYFRRAIVEAARRRDAILSRSGAALASLPSRGAFVPSSQAAIDGAAESARFGIVSVKHPDLRSLKSLVLYGLKGIAAYVDHAHALGRTDKALDEFTMRAMAALIDDGIGHDALVALALETGKFGVDAMALLDGANTGAYGDPRVTKVRTGVRGNPGILVSGHDLKDLHDLLEQTKGSGVDVYTHGEMLPAHYYPFFERYGNLVGNYGGAWYAQGSEFESFNGPIVLTSNCLVPPKESYKKRVFTTGVVAFDGCPTIGERPEGGMKDFSAVIELAKSCPPPKQIEDGVIVGGFAHAQVKALAGKVVDAIKSGKLRKFVVMAGCDGRQPSRSYYTDFAKKLPEDVVILTAGCAKYRYNKLDLGDIDGIPRVLDAGQCNDSYSLAVTALTLKEAFGMADVNELPIAFNVAWYEQKAVLVLLALLHLGFKNIHLGPTLPAFLSPNVAKLLVSTFGIGGISAVDEDVRLLVG
jgi:hydroxylamine reductase